MGPDIPYEDSPIYDEICRLFVSCRPLTPEEKAMGKDYALRPAAGKEG